MLLASRARARRELLRYSDRALVDAGFSRELLETDVGAWPWRFDDDSAAAARAMHAARARRVGVEIERAGWHAVERRRAA